MGEVDLVEHKIAMKEHELIRAPPHRLPYALREELESSLVISYWILVVLNLLAALTHQNWCWCIRRLVV